jgi:hypothetical protein
MVLLSEAKLSDRQMNKATLIWMQAVPLNQYIEGCHREGQPSLEVLPNPMANFLEVTDRGQHRKDGFDDHTHIPLTAFTDFHVRRVIFFAVETSVYKNNHLTDELGDQSTKTTVMHIGSVTSPGHHQPQMVQNETQLASNNPTMVGKPLFANLGRATTLTHRMDQLTPIAHTTPQHSRLSKKTTGPVGMCLEQAKQSRSFGQPRKQSLVISLNPTIKCSITNPFERKQNAQCYDLARPQIGLGMLRYPFHRIINPAEQFDDKILCGHGAPPLLLSHHN